MSVLHERQQAAFGPEAHDIECVLQVVSAVFG